MKNTLIILCFAFVACQPQKQADWRKLIDQPADTLVADFDTALYNKVIFELNKDHKETFGQKMRISQYDTVEYTNQKRLLITRDKDERGYSEKRSNPESNFVEKIQYHFNGKPRHKSIVYKEWLTVGKTFDYDSAGRLVMVTNLEEGFDYSLDSVLDFIKMYKIDPNKISLTRYRDNERFATLPGVEHKEAMIYNLAGGFWMISGIQPHDYHAMELRASTAEDTLRASITYSVKWNILLNGKTGKSECYADDDFFILQRYEHYEQTTDKDSLFTEHKEYHPNGQLGRLYKTFKWANYVGKEYEYDDAGKLISTIDHDQGKPYTADSLLAYLKRNNINPADVSFDNYGNYVFWVIQYNYKPKEYAKILSMAKNNADSLAARIGVKLIISKATGKVYVVPPPIPRSHYIFNEQGKLVCVENCDTHFKYSLDSVATFLKLRGVKKDWSVRISCGLPDDIPLHEYPGKYEWSLKYYKKNKWREVLLDAETGAILRDTIFFRIEN